MSTQSPHLAGRLLAAVECSPYQGPEVARGELQHPFEADNALLPQILHNGLLPLFITDHVGGPAATHILLKGAEVVPVPSERCRAAFGIPPWTDLCLLLPEQVRGLSIPFRELCNLSHSLACLSLGAARLLFCSCSSQQSASQQQRAKAEPQSS